MRELVLLLFLHDAVLFGSLLLGVLLLLLFLFLFLLLVGDLAVKVLVDLLLRREQVDLLALPSEAGRSAR